MTSQSVSSIYAGYAVDLGLLWKTNTHPFIGPLSGTTQVSRCQKGKTSLDFTEARDREWQWHQLGHMQVCTSLQADNHTSTPPLSFLTGRMPFLPPNQQRQSTEGNSTEGNEPGSAVENKPLEKKFCVSAKVSQWLE